MSFAARPGECPGTINAGIKSLCLTPSKSPKPGVCIERYVLRSKSTRGQPSVGCSVTCLYLVLVQNKFGVKDKRKKKNVSFLSASFKEEIIS